MTARRDLLKARFTMVRKDLDECLDRITPDMLDWAPAPGMRTVAGQIVEIVGTEMQIVALLREGRRISDPETKASMGDCNDLKNLRRAIDAARRETLAYLDSLSDAELAEEVEFRGGWFGSLGLPTVPRAEVFVNVADHEWYHVGQLTSYLWARGIDPYT